MDSKNRHSQNLFIKFSIYLKKSSLVELNILNLKLYLLYMYMVKLSKLDLVGAWFSFDHGPTQCNFLTDLHTVADSDNVSSHLTIKDRVRVVFPSKKYVEFGRQTWFWKSLLFIVFNFLNSHCFDCERYDSKNKPQTEFSLCLQNWISIKNSFAPMNKNIVFFASEAPLCTRFQNLMKSFD